MVQRTKAKQNLRTVWKQEYLYLVGIYEIPSVLTLGL